jgi:hypothetical protein
MGGILVKCSTGVGDVKAQDQKIEAFGSSYRIAVGDGFSTDEKKGLAKQDLS